MQIGKKTKNLLLICALAAIFIFLFLFPGSVPAGEEYAPYVYRSVFSLLPPVIAITLALLTKEVYFSLFIGILAGGLLYCNGNLASPWKRFFTMRTEAL